MDKHQPITHEELMVVASRFFLTNPLPEQYYEWDEDEIEDFMKSNAWLPFETYSGFALFQIIESAAGTMTQYLHSRKVKVQE